MLPHLSSMCACCAGDTIYTSKVYTRGKSEGFGFLLELREDPDSRVARLRVEGKIREMAVTPEFTKRVRFAEIAPFFETRAPEYILQLIDPTLGTLLYKDGNHLNADGAMRVEQLFRKEIFDQLMC